MGFFDFLYPRRAVRGHSKLENGKQLPVVKFDASNISDAVQKDLRQNVVLLCGSQELPATYRAALKSVTSGRDLATLAKSLVSIHGMSMHQAAEISRALNNRATALIQRDKQLKLGIEFARWRYSGSPCAKQQDSAHKAADGQKYSVREGNLLNGKPTWPGYESGCKCIAISIIPGIEDEP